MKRKIINLKKCHLESDDHISVCICTFKRARMLENALKGLISQISDPNFTWEIIIIDNGNNYETRFAHLNRILVKKGQTVKKGKVIAKSGKTGRVTGPHLHYEIRYKKQPMNPMKL